jgi:hypothetical protein
MKVRSTKALTIITDCIMSALLITAPWLFGIARGDMIPWMAAGTGGYTIIYSLSTCYEHISIIIDQELRRHVVRDEQVG